VGIEDATIAEGNTFTDAAEGADGNVLPELRVRVNYGCGVNQLVFLFMGRVL
jgi:hypothetical protein